MFTILIDGAWQGGSWKTEDAAELAAVSLREKNPGKDVAVVPKRERTVGPSRDREQAHAAEVAGLKAQFERYAREQDKAHAAEVRELGTQIENLERALAAQPPKPEPKAPETPAPKDDAKPTNPSKSSKG